MVQKKMLYKNASAVASSISFEMVVLPAKKLQKSDLEWSDCGSITWFRHDLMEVRKMTL